MGIGNLVSSCFRENAGETRQDAHELGAVSQQAQGDPAAFERDLQRADPLQIAAPVNVATHSPSADVGNNAQAQNAQHARGISSLFQSRKGPELIVGCGREGNIATIEAIRKKQHMHAEKGVTTLDIDPRNNPDIVGDITNKGVALSLIQSQNLPKFGKVTFEAVPAGLFGTSESASNAIENARLLSADKSRLTVTMGASETEGPSANLKQALLQRGYKVTSQNIVSGQMKTKAHT